MSDFQKTLAKSMKDPEFKKLWEEDELEYQIISMIISARAEKGLTQSDLSRIAGIRQSNISRIESGKCTPSIDSLNKIATALGKRLILEFK